jgi:hypothetical protein
MFSLAESSTIPTTKLVNLACMALLQVLPKAIEVQEHSGLVLKSNLTDPKLAVQNGRAFFLDSCSYTPKLWLDPVIAPRTAPRMSRRKSSIDPTKSQYCWPTGPESVGVRRPIRTHYARVSTCSRPHAVIPEHLTAPHPPDRHGPQGETSRPARKHMKCQIEFQDFLLPSPNNINVLFSLPASDRMYRVSTRLEPLHHAINRRSKPPCRNVPEE